MEKEFIDTAIILSRMYGVAETLNPIPYRSNADMLELIRDWAAEYIESKETDIVHFFEKKIKDFI